MIRSLGQHLLDNCLDGRLHFILWDVFEGLRLALEMRCVALGQLLLNRLDGSLELEGLVAPVSIERDALGIPTLRATNRSDLSRATTRGSSATCS